MPCTYATADHPVWEQDPSTDCTEGVLPTSLQSSKRAAMRMKGDSLP